MSEPDRWRFCHETEKVFREVYGKCYHANRKGQGWACFVNGAGGRVFPSIKAFDEYIELANAPGGDEA